MTESCKVRIDNELKKTLGDLRKLWDLYHKDPDDSDDDLGNMYDYGLSFDYVAPGTFNDQNEEYFRYQLSWGGPSDEFRIYADKAGNHRWNVYRIEYAFLDWFDGATRGLHGKGWELIEDIFQSFFVDSCTADHQYDLAVSD